MRERSMIDVLAGRRVAIIGDIMLDQYVTGSVARISPEAPVPVLHVGAERAVLGAAANAAANVIALGGAVDLVGVIGDDAAGRQITTMLEALGRVTLGLVTAPSHPTITKTRYVSGQQQIIRVDREVRDPLTVDTVDALIAEVQVRIASCACVVLSDYGKGVLSDRVIAAAIELARAQNKPIIVDPKRPTFEPYRGASYITPNRKELTDATGLPCDQDAEAAIAAGVAMAQSQAAILLTRSERGMSLYRQGKEPIHLQADAREVFDVTGAGDTVVASMALGLAAGLPVDSAMRIANAAAGVVVGKLGAATCTPRELLAALERNARLLSRADSQGDDRVHDGVTSRADAVQLRDQWERQGLKVGFANGCFDLIHPGHVSLLRQAAAACDRLIVAINSDASVRALKGETRPVQTQDARAQVLMGVKGVDMVVVFDEPTPLALVEALRPDVIVKGSDYKEHEVVGGDVVKARGGSVLLVDLVAGHSTSSLVARANGGGS